MALKSAKICVLITVLSLLLLHCSTEEASREDVADANLQVIAAVSAKNGQCGGDKQLAGFLFQDPDRNDLQACVFGLLTVSCEQWAEADPMPAVCKAQGVAF